MSMFGSLDELLGPQLDPWRSPRRSIRRATWAREHSRAQKNLASARKGGCAAGIASKSWRPGVGLDGSGNGCSPRDVGEGGR